jgi:hypothetical protein
MGDGITACQPLSLVMLPGLQFDPGDCRYASFNEGREVSVKPAKACVTPAMRMLYASRATRRPVHTCPESFQVCSHTLHAVSRRGHLCVFVYTHIEEWVYHPRRRRLNAPTFLCHPLLLLPRPEQRAASRTTCRSAHGGQTRCA